MRFRNRIDAGLELGPLIADVVQKQPEILVLGLPRGGVPVAHGVAASVGGELDVFVVRKLRAPGHPELAMGAVASGGTRVLNESIIEGLGIQDDAIVSEELVQLAELARRESVYRPDRAPLNLDRRTVILTDDGAATGATMMVAVQAVASMRPKSIVVALPVASTEAAAMLTDGADEVVVIATPSRFGSVGSWYQDFAQTSDDEVRELLAQSSSG